MESLSQSQQRNQTSSRQEDVARVLVSQDTIAQEKEGMGNISFFDLMKKETLMTDVGWILGSVVSSSIFYCAPEIMSRCQLTEGYPRVTQSSAGPFLLNMSPNNLDKGREGILMKLALDIQLRGLTRIQDGSIKIRKLLKPQTRSQK